MSTLSAFLYKQRMRWYGRGIDRSHELRRRLAHHVAMHGFEIGDYSIGKPTVRRYCDSKLKVGRYCSIAEGVTFLLGGIHRTDTVTTSVLELSRNRPGPPQGDILVGSDVWIAANALILSGDDRRQRRRRCRLGRDRRCAALRHGIWKSRPRAPQEVSRRCRRDAVGAALWDLEHDAIEALRPLLQSDDIDTFIEQCRRLRGRAPSTAGNRIRGLAPAPSIAARAPCPPASVIALIGSEIPGSRRTISAPRSNAWISTACE